MTKLNDADAIYAGTRAVPRVYLGGTEIWTPPVGMLIVGSEVVGDDSFPSSDGRVLVDRYYIPVDAYLQAIHVHTHSSGTDPAGVARGLVFTDTAGPAPNALEGIGEEVDIDAVDAWFRSEFTSPPLLTAGWHWGGFTTQGVYTTPFNHDTNMASGGGWDDNNGGMALRGEEFVGDPTWPGGGAVVGSGNSVLTCYLELIPA